jgi:hypothetical protein
LPNEVKKEYMEMYRPPGIIKVQDTVVGAKHLLDEKIIFTVPTTKLFRRGKADDKKEDKFERSLAGTMGNNMTTMQAE